MNYEVMSDNMLIGYYHQLDDIGYKLIGENDNVADMLCDEADEVESELNRRGRYCYCYLDKNFNLIRLDDCSICQLY